VPLLPVRLEIRPAADGGGAAYFFQDDPVGYTSPAALHERLRRYMREHGENPEIPLMLRPDGSVPWGCVVEAFAQAERAGFGRIGFPP
jgi:biopolymer transport protein ExbD